MREAVDSSMWKAAHGESISEEKLLEWLEDWGLHDPDNSPEGWLVWRRSNYVVLPYPELGWYGQPWWVRKDFLTLDLVREYFDKQVHKPSLDGVIDPLAEYE